jgi:hypothetical protein
MIKRIRLSNDTLAAAAEIWKLYGEGKVFDGFEVKSSRALSAATKRFDQRFAADLCAMLDTDGAPRQACGYYLYNLTREIRVPLGNGYCGVGVHDYGARRSYYIGIAKC